VGGGGFEHTKVVAAEAASFCCSAAALDLSARAWPSRRQAPGAARTPWTGSSAAARTDGHAGP